ncbi:thiamine biosynthesis protein ThiC [Erythrobacter sp. KY5]|uniref:thiamine biosynthesis protein ThiC n=1 Tax=Erythrobacter sp. KY5 TaxID=2011159 RepID=UPI000DBF381B|nr:thiamine biosynthesis protein ThiC [Erythrobacter sp. KY5]AWW75697.1 thiamine biosynthesis protein ThiC [Erythrobacter sp. KY5]
MHTAFHRNATIVASLLLIAAVTQAIYTALHAAEMDVPRQFLWGTEGVLFTILAAFAGAAMVQVKEFHVGWAAIAASAVLNVVQVGVGLTLFGPFFEVAGELPQMAPVASAIVAYSFMVYNAAKVLIALAAVVFGLGQMSAGSKAVGGLTAIVGAVALVSNALSAAMGRDFAGGLPIAGGSGVAATVLLAVCLFAQARADAAK